MIRVKNKLQFPALIRRLLPYLGLLAFIFFSYQKLLSIPGLTISDDMGYDVLPNLKFFADNIARGILPLWNPYCESGVMTITTPFIGPFYPLFFLFYVIPGQWFLNIQFFIHLCLAAVFLFMFNKEIGLRNIPALVAASIFIFSSVPQRIIAGGYVTFGVGLLWLPVLLYFSEKLINNHNKPYLFVWLLGLSVSLMFFASHTYAVYLSCFTAIVYSLLRIAFSYKITVKIKLLLLLILSYFIALCFSAVHLLHYGKGIFGSGWHLGARATIFFTPHNLFIYLFPSFYTFEKFHILVNNYMGVATVSVLLASFFIPKDKFRKYCVIFITLGLLSLVIAFGKYGFLADFLRRTLPFFNTIMDMEIWEYIFLLSMGLVAGITLQKIGDLLRESKDRIIAVAFRRSFLLSLFLILLAYYIFSTYLKSTPEYLLVFKKDIFRTIIFLFSPALFVALVMRFKNFAHKDKLIIIGLSVFIIFDLIQCQQTAFGTRMITGNCYRNDGKFEYYTSNDIIDFIRQDQEKYFRIFRDNWPRIEENKTTAFGIFDVKGIYNTPISEYRRFVSYVFKKGGSMESFCRNLFQNADSKLTDILNIKYAFYGKNNQPASDKFIFIKELNSGVKVYKNKNYVPRAFLVPEVVVAKGEAALGVLERESFDITKAAVAQEEGIFKGKTGEVFCNAADFLKSEHSVEITEYNPNRIALITNSDYPSFLVLSEIYSTGWKAYIDGKREAVYRTNYILRGLPLDKGRHKVVFKYSPLEFIAGAWISILTALIFIAYVFKFAARRNSK
ncbi:MAG: YfhO family protein [Candidatus Omnitrophica bacterium]|nr:YfhO family protein [Candidatus Omnitrophota bacterium]